MARAAWSRRRVLAGLLFLPFTLAAIFVFLLDLSIALRNG